MPLHAERKFEGLERAKSVNARASRPTWRGGYASSTFLPRGRSECLAERATRAEDTSGGVEESGQEAFR